MQFVTLTSRWVSRKLLLRRMKTTFLLAVTLLAVSPVFSEVRLSVEERIASRKDSSWTRGDGTAASSQLYDGGIHLEAAAKVPGDPSIAVAAYRWNVSPTVKRLRLTISYETNLAATANQGVAGSVWVSGLSKPLEGTPERGVLGDMFVLSSQHTQAQFDIPAMPSVAAGFVEIHLVASAGFSLDIAWLRLETFDEGGRYVVGQAPVTQAPVIQFQPHQLSANNYYYGTWYHCWQPNSYSVIIINQPPPSTTETTVPPSTISSRTSSPRTPYEVTKGPKNKFEETKLPIQPLQPVPLTGSALVTPVATVVAPSSVIVKPLESKPINVKPISGKRGSTP